MAPPPTPPFSEPTLPARRRGSTVAKNLHPWMPRRLVVAGGRAHLSLLRSRAAPERVHRPHPTARRRNLGIRWSVARQTQDRKRSHARPPVRNPLCEFRRPYPGSLPLHVLRQLKLGSSGCWRRHPHPRANKNKKRNPIQPAWPTGSQGCLAGLIQN